MKDVTLQRIALIVCVTAAAMFFHCWKLLWFYLIALALED